MSTAARAVAREELAEMTAVAESALRHGGADALGTLGWEPGPLTCETDRRVAAALFRASGRALAVTPALGRLAAAALRGAPPGAMLATAPRSGDPADPPAGRVALTGPTGLGAAATVVVLVGDELFLATGVEPRVPSSAALDLEAIEHGSVAASNMRPLGGGATMAPDLAGALGAARLALAHEILGACDAAMQLAVQHTRDRVQFGSPIGTFQALQHVLAEAESQRVGLETACATTVADGIDGGAPPSVTLAGAHLKALAGRVGRAVMQATLQALGAIGFTEEHVHHRYLRRVLAADALFGPASTLVAELGLHALSTGRVWQQPVLIDRENER